MELASDSLRRLLDIARAAITAKLSGRDDAAAPVATAEIEPSLQQPAGCFVSLHDLQTHALRGCVGRLDAKDPLVHVVHDTARGVLDDPRFTDKPVTLDELPRLLIEISVLSPLEPARDTLDFDLLNDGIFLHLAGHSGCFLPQVARETGWTKEQLLDRLCAEKLGLPARAWQSPEATMERFKVYIVGPEPFVV
jgi:AmmeMemoRadiSam system protein A